MAWISKSCPLGPPKVMTGLMFISELFTLAWFGGAFNEQPMYCFFTQPSWWRKKRKSREYTQHKKQTDNIMI
ncbi:hypothetical protein ATO46_16425 [Aeromonas schubertii]|nr:hypothetical protein ATO46_16425 [Aeromonas schubertii]